MKKSNLILNLFIISSILLLNIGFINPVVSSYKNESGLSFDTQWIASLTFIESGGGSDSIIFGESFNASDGLDLLDAPNPPGGFPPFLDASFKTNFSWPYTNLLQEIKYYPDSYKIWNITMSWTGGSTSVDISWDIDQLNTSEYSIIYLLDDSNNTLADMLNENNYTFNCPSYSTFNFKIICISNQPPITYNDLYSTLEDCILIINPPGVLDNDIDLYGPDELSAFLENDTIYGNLTFNSDGSFEYIPPINWSGIDTFTYYAFDGEYYSNIASVSITVESVNDNPIANDDYAIVKEYSVDNQIDVLANDYDIDGDNLTLLYVTNPVYGISTFDDKFVYYTPNQGYFGEDYFIYSITDNNGSIGVTAFVYIDVTENPPPEKPDRPSGKTQGKVGEQYTYSTKTSDIDNDLIYYNFSWGDETTSGWIGPYDSDVTVEASHTWLEKGYYEIKVKSKDEHDQESEWSDPLPITMPLSKINLLKNKIISFIQKLFDLFSNKINLFLDKFI